MNIFQERQTAIRKEHEELLSRKNRKLYSTNGIFNRYQYPVLTRDHFPLEWRFDFNPEPEPSSGKGSISWLSVQRATTANPSLPLQRAPTGWTISGSGSGR